MITISPSQFEESLIARHTLAVHNKLRSATIGLAGLGGLGSNIATALVRMGIGRIKGYDFDIVDLSNINRQNYFIDQIGLHKTVALKDTLLRISPITELIFEDVKISKQNSSTLFDGCDIIIEAFDTPEAKAMLFASCAENYPNIPYIGASGVAGYDNMESIKVRKIGANRYIVGDFTTALSDNVALMAAKVGIVAHMQANLAANIIIKGQ